MVSTSSERLTRAYSLTGACDKPTTYEITVKLIRAGDDSGSDGRMSTHIHGLKIGDVLALEAPGGTFTPPVRGDRPIILMAAGIGITPFVSYVDALAKTSAGLRPPGIHLIYVCRNRREHPFGARLRSAASAIPELQSTYIFTSPTECDSWEATTITPGDPPFCPFHSRSSIGVRSLTSAVRRALLRTRPRAC